jgi:hypothetical protein
MIMCNDWSSIHIYIERMIYTLYTEYKLTSDSIYAYSRIYAIE